MVIVLVISMIIALAIQDWISGGVIAFVVFLNIFVGFIQEYKAEKTMGSLKSLSSPSARVLRDGIETNINAEEVVPGDIVVINAGDTIPADLRLIDSKNLETDEALLTGESLPVAKNHEETYRSNEPVPVGDRLNMAFSSSLVAKGRAQGIVVSTGLYTEIGKIADSLKNSDHKLIVRVKKPSLKNYTKATLKSTRNIIQNVLGTNVGTPLQRKLSWLAIFLFWVAVVFAIVVMGSQKMIVNKNVAIYAICVALSMIPSSLIVVLTITMAIGAQVMVSKHVIVRKLDSLEALGGVDDICSDKTGTLTLGKMIAKKLWIPSVGTFSVQNSNEPFNPTVGEVVFSEHSPKYIKEVDEEVDFSYHLPQDSNQYFNNWLMSATLANIASVKEVDGEWQALGDATEIAINVFTTRLGWIRDEVENINELKHLNEFPFDSAIKRMSAVYEANGEVKIYTKGAVERLVNICNTWYVDGKLVPLTEEDHKTIEDNMTVLSSQGLRVLAFAQRHLRSVDEVDIQNRDAVESELTFLGLIGIYDPPRPESAKSVQLCHKAGISVHMLTGDHPGTAKAIAQEVGILPHNLYHYSRDVVEVMVMTAMDFDALTDDQIDALPVLPLVIARCAPQTKVRMIEALHRRGKFVAMTGDGVNDSPSLKKADVGIAMGMNGSDVAKDAADIVLTDDNFASILNAVEEGRRMSSNIQKFVLQLLAENVAQALYLMIGLVFIDEDGFSVFPLAPVEVLWIIVITSCFPAMGLGQEKAQDDILELPPNNKIFTREVLVDMFAYGTWMAACCLAIFVITVYGKGDGDLGHNCNSHPEHCSLVFKGRSAAFVAFTWCALLLAWECVHMRRSFFLMRPESELTWYHQLWLDVWENKFLFWSIIGGFVSVFPVVYIPVINDKVFLHGPISWEWGLAIGFTVLFLAGSEAYKWLKRIYLRKQKAKDAFADLSVFERYVSLSKSNTMDV
ncbi:Na+ ATPase [Spathaspora passalidarum NRRL Y-27907]|uniref:P-type Na(+) transporter n=1 Tax=Spathaspora passalidarum (strain NRRL Y-27907 / 11-Y1) TaxID=619300 RepID=G3AVG8_SPAPN|nr:Na+ ATPase [Spathaspora passalidarum NRRL Y-27907]EGW29917.1 Na+ ATPase [Spathaspora passalidarum NRRL Y-27907]